jgi:hypothetical protein
MQFCLKETTRMMVKKRKTRLFAFSSSFRLQATGFLQAFALSKAKYPPAEWIRLTGPDPRIIPDFSPVAKQVELTA